MHCVAGCVHIDKTGHKVAYCAQNPCQTFFFFFSGLILIFGWFIGLEHATIRDNIVFGNTSPFDEARYQSVLDACALRQDLAIFDAGDMTGRYLSAKAFVLRWYFFFWRNRRERHYLVWRSACSCCTSSSNVLSRKGVHLRKANRMSF